MSVQLKEKASKGTSSVFGSKVQVYFASKHTKRLAETGKGQQNHKKASNDVKKLAEKQNGFIRPFVI